MMDFDQWAEAQLAEISGNAPKKNGEAMAVGQGDDGDNDRGRRIDGYDAPETYKEVSDFSKSNLGNPNAYLAVEGKEFLAKNGARIVDNGEKDYYGRGLVDAYTSHNTRLADEMAASGLALPMDDQSYDAWVSAQTARNTGRQGSSYAELEALGGIARANPTQLGEMRPWYEGHDFGKQGHGFGDSVARGVDSMQKDLGGFMQWLGRSLGAKELEEYGRKQVLHNSFELENNAPEIARFDDIDSVSDAITYAVETAGSLAPQLLVDLAIGAVTGGASVAATAARGALTKLAAGQALKRGAMLGTAASSMTSGIGGMENTLKENGIESNTAPLLAGAAIGLLDVLPVFDAFEKLAKTAGISDQAKRTAMQRIGNVAVSAAGTGAKEGLVSTAQAIIEQATLATQDPNYEWSQDKLLDIVDQGLRGVIGGGMAMGASTAGIEMYHHAADTMKAYDERRRAEIDAALTTGETPNMEDAATALDAAQEAALKAEADKVAPTSKQDTPTKESPNRTPKDSFDSEYSPEELQELNAEKIALRDAKQAEGHGQSNPAENRLTKGDHYTRPFEASDLPDIDSVDSLYRPAYAEAIRAIEDFDSVAGSIPVTEADRQRQQLYRQALQLSKSTPAKEISTTVRPEENAAQVAYNELIAEARAERQGLHSQLEQLEKQRGAADAELAQAEAEYSARKTASSKKLVKARAEKRIEEARAAHKEASSRIEQKKQVLTEKLFALNEETQRLTDEMTGGKRPDEKTTPSKQATNLEVQQHYNNKVREALADDTKQVWAGAEKGKPSALITKTKVEAPKTEIPKPDFTKQQTDMDKLREEAYRDGLKALGLDEDYINSVPERQRAEFKRSTAKYGMAQNPEKYADVNRSEIRTRPENKKLATEVPEPEAPAIGSKVEVKEQGERVGLGTKEDDTPRVSAAIERRIRDMMVVRDRNGKTRLRPLAEAELLVKQHKISDHDMAAFLANTMNPNGPTAVVREDSDSAKITTLLTLALDHNAERDAPKNEKTKKEAELRQWMKAFDDGKEVRFEEVKNAVLMKGFEWGKELQEKLGYDWKSMYVASGGTNKAKSDKVARARADRNKPSDEKVADNKGVQNSNEKRRNAEAYKAAMADAIEGAANKADAVKITHAKTVRANEYTHTSDFFKKKFGDKVATAVEMHIGGRGKGGHVVAMLAKAIQWLSAPTKDSSIELRKLSDIVQKDFRLNPKSKDVVGRVFEVLESALAELPKVGRDVKSSAGELPESAFNAYRKATADIAKTIQQQKEYLELYESTSKKLSAIGKKLADPDFTLPDDITLDLMRLRLGSEFIGQNREFVEAAYAEAEGDNLRVMDEKQVASVTSEIDTTDGEEVIEHELSVAEAEETPLIPWLADIIAENQEFLAAAEENLPKKVDEMTPADWLDSDELFFERLESAESYFDQLGAEKTTKKTPDFIDGDDIAAIKKDREVRGQQIYDLFNQLWSLMRGTKDKALSDTMAEIAGKIAGKVNTKNRIHLYPARIAVRFEDGIERYSDALTEAGDSVRRPLNRNLQSTVLAKIKDIALSDKLSIDDKAAEIDVILRSHNLIDDAAKGYISEAKGKNDVGTIGEATLSRMTYKPRRDGSLSGSGILMQKDGSNVKMKANEITKFGMSRTIFDETTQESDTVGADIKGSLKNRIYEGFLGGLSALAGMGYTFNLKSLDRATVVYYALGDRERPVTWGELLDYSRVYGDAKTKKRDESVAEKQKEWLADHEDEVEKLGVDPSEFDSLVHSLELEVIQREINEAPDEMGHEDVTDMYNSLAETHDKQAADDIENLDLRKDPIAGFFEKLESEAKTSRAVRDAIDKAAKAAREAKERGVDVDRLPKGRLAQLERATKNGLRISKAKPILTAWVRSTRTRLSRLNYKVAEALDRITVDSDSRFNAFRSKFDKEFGDDLAVAMDDYNAGRDTALGKKFRAMMDEVFNYAESLNPDFVRPDIVAQIKRDALLANRSTFISLLKEAGIKEPETLYEELVKTHGTLDMGITPKVMGVSRKMQELAPAFTALKNAGFIEDNASSLMTSFLYGITQRSEWAREFGREVDGKFDINYGYETATRILHPDDAREVNRLVEGALGQFARDKYPVWLRKTNTALLTLQTATVLWLAGVASIPELGSVFVANRGNLNELHKDIAKVARAQTLDRAKSREIAEVFGLVSRSITEQSLMQLVASGEITDSAVARSISNFVFKWSGQNLITDMAHLSGTVMGRDYLARNARAALKGDAIAKERLYELGITEEQVAAYMMMEASNGGKPVELRYDRDDKGKAWVNPAVEAYHMALARFLEGSTAVPSRMDVPLMMNDPRFVLFTSLKKFFYGYWNTVHKGIYRDMKQRRGASKISPAVIAASVILPLAFCAEWMREEIKYPSLLGQERKNRLTITDWLEKVITATGGLGPAQAVANALTASEYSGNFLISLLGPSVNLAFDMVDGDLADNPARLVPIVGQQPQLKNAFNKGVHELVK